MAKLKRLTVSQCNILLKHKLNPKDWFYAGIQMIAQSDGVGDHLSRNQPKDAYMVISHRATGEQRRIRV